MTDPLTYAAAALVGTLAVARGTRLVVHDSWPPMAWVRDRWIAWAGQHAPNWVLLLTCPFCFAPYAAAADLTWVLLAGLDGASWWSAAWWVANTWAAVAYVAAQVVVRDEPPEE